jgi:hypothetical protein
VGGPGNSLDRNYHNSIEKDINFIAERTSNTNVGFVGLLRRHDKLWMDRKVRSMNLYLEWALMGCGNPSVVLSTLTVLWGKSTRPMACI